MSLINIIKKEMRELLTPSTILPIVMAAFIFAAMGGIIGDVEEDAKSVPKIGIVDLDNSTISRVAVSSMYLDADVIYNNLTIDDGIEKLKEEKGVALLIITESFSESILNNSTGVIGVRWFMHGAGISDIISTGSINSIINNVDQKIASYLMENKTNISPYITLNPTSKNETTIFKDKIIEDASPAEINATISAQSSMTPIVMMLIIMMAGGTVITSMALEKENKTLETLLTLPVRRTSIVAGKIIGSAIVGLLMAVIYMVGFGFYMESLQPKGVNLAEYGLSLSLLDYFLMGLSLFVALTAALSLCMVLGTFAKNYKSSQSLTVPLVALSLIPMFIIMFRDVETLPLALKILLFAIPFSHPMMAMNFLLFDNYLMVVFGIVYVTLFAAFLIAICVRIFTTDQIMMGKLSRKE